MRKYAHWEIQTDPQSIVWLGLNRSDATVNTINDQVLDELNLILDELTPLGAQGFIIYSHKTNGFIAGADIHAFTQFKDPLHIAEFLQKGQTVFTRIATLPFPTVAMIDGFCMGGGLELALACDYRIASDQEATRLGLPEILLGFHPGWGATVRLPLLIGGYDALTKVILTGQVIPAIKAKQLGILDDVVPVRQLKRAAVYYITHRPAKHSPTRLQSISNYPWVRTLLGAILRRQIAKKMQQAHYPAPFAVIDLWEKQANSRTSPYEEEARSVITLVTESATASNLIRIFQLRERLKGFAKETRYNARHVHVIGAGIMGGDIAAWCALRGLYVTLQDKSYLQIAPAIGRAHNLFKKKLHHSRLIQAAMDRLIADPDGHGVKQADIIIEAIFEDLTVKQTVIKTIELQAKPDAIIATNTSSIPLDDMNQVMADPQRLVGIHFFNPVAKMELVEIVSGSKTSITIQQHACAFVHQIGRLPLPVKSSTGFLVNRVLMPYLMECMQLLQEGYPAEKIDQAALSFGMVMGPVTLADKVGLDVCLAVAKNLTAKFGGAVPLKLEDLVKANKLGQKTGEGFYRYKNGKPINHPVIRTLEPSEITYRLILRMVNEAAACIREGVVADADLLDAGMIFGTGFAPFYGGPLHYAQHLGREHLLAQLTKLAASHGERFNPDPALADILQ